MKQAIRFFKQTILFGSFFSLVIFLVCRLVIYPLPFPVAEALTLLLQMFLTTCFVVLLIRSLFEGLVLGLVFIQSRYKNKHVKKEEEPSIYFKLVNGERNIA